MESHDTQPLDEHSSDPSTCSSASSSTAPPVYAKLKPLMDLIPQIELRKDSFTCGRGGVEPVDYDFAVIRSIKPCVYNVISKQHFRLERIRDQTILTDLSFNGTYVNQKLVGKFCTHVLQNGDIISCGRADTLIFQYEEDSRQGYPVELTNKYIMTTTALGKGGYGAVMLGRLRSNCQHEVAVKILDITQLSRRFSRALSRANDVEKEVAIMLQIKHYRWMLATRDSV